ncbi:hypothetical protein BKA70DRAFT_1231801 [Coprinopsis sp. MPI-PUGE-AT-0042]|nr:hypothetical protein BKA70DRAFT_1231801 [Coprinopsis sp. MPI-PUGE-AT-0042]
MNPSHEPMHRNSSLSHHSRRLPGRTLPVALGSMQEVIITQPCRKTVSLLRGEMHCVYPQLCKHGTVPLSDRIEADVKTSAWFLDEKQSQLQALCEAGGGIVQLLEAYFNMVGDIQYSPGGLQAQEKLSSSGHASDEDEEGQELDVGNTAILPATPIKSRFCFKYQRRKVFIWHYWTFQWRRRPLPLKLKKPVMAKHSSSTSFSSAASHSNLKSASPSVTASPPASRLGGFTIGGLVAGNGQGTGSRGSVPASPFATSFRTDSRSLLKKEVLDPGSASPSLRGRESGGGKLPLLSNGLAHAGPQDPPSSNSRAQSPPTMTVSPPATTELSTVKSSTSPTTTISPQHPSPPISPPSTATSATTSSTQPPSEILNLQHHFQLIEEGWKRESMVPSSRASPTAEGNADLSSQSLDLLSAQIDPLHITKKSPTFPPSPFLPPPDWQESVTSLSSLPSPCIQNDAKLEVDSLERAAAARCISREDNLDFGTRCVGSDFGYSICIDA